jgi:hypothetical protein
MNVETLRKLGESGRGTTTPKANCAGEKSGMVKVRHAYRQLSGAPGTDTVDYSGQGWGSIGPTQLISRRNRLPPPFISLNNSVSRTFEPVLPTGQGTALSGSADSSICRLSLRLTAGRGIGVSYQDASIHGYSHDLLDRQKDLHSRALD